MELTAPSAVSCGVYVREQTRACSFRSVAFTTGERSLAYKNLFFSRAVLLLKLDELIQMCIAPNGDERKIHEQIKCFLGGCVCVFVCVPVVCAE